MLRCYPTDRAYEEPFKAKHFAASGGVIECIVSSTDLLSRMSLIYSCKAVNWSDIEGRSSNSKKRQRVRSSNMTRMSTAHASTTSSYSVSPGYSTSSGYADLTDHFPARNNALEADDSAVDTDREDVWDGEEDVWDGEEDVWDGEEDVWNGEEDVASEGGIDNPDLQVIETKNIKAMGLAAGGKLSVSTPSLAHLHHPIIYHTVQDIYKDPYPATTWNHAAARILHIHILDPVSCEKVTHIVPTPPNTDVKAYTEAGGQYFVVEEKVDERLEGGDFDNVKSVSQMDQHIGITTEPEFDPTKPKMCTTCELRLCDCMYVSPFYPFQPTYLILTHTQYPPLRPPILQHLHQAHRAEQQRRRHGHSAQDLEMSDLRQCCFARSRFLSADEPPRRRAVARQGPSQCTQD